MKPRLLPILAVFALAGVTGRPAVAQQEGAHPHRMDGTAGFHHSFKDAAAWAKAFDAPDRDGWQKPGEILNALHLAPASIVADLGAGTGYFSLKLSRLLPDGKVFAADIEPDMLHYIHERARREHLSNIVPVLAGQDAANLPAPADLILVVDTYHHIDNRVRYFAKLKTSLSPEGRLAIVDFKADAPEGPPKPMRIAPEKVVKELAAAGYVLAETHDFLPRQYFLVFKKGSS